MAIQILGTSPELTLIFDRSTLWRSSRQIRLLGETLKAVEGVESVSLQTVWYRKPQIRVVFNSETEPNSILRKMAKALRTPSDPISTSSHLITRNLPAIMTTNASDDVDTDSRGPLFFESAKDLSGEEGLSIRNRFRSAAYGALAVGSFVMSWIGLIVPGIPTVPFVLLTAHFALQASPSLRDRLLKSPMFGPMIRDWQQYGAIHRVVQIEAYALMIVMIVVGFIFSPPIPILYVGMGIASAMGLYAISQIPVIESLPEGQTMLSINRLIMKPEVVV